MGDLLTRLDVPGSDGHVAASRHESRLVPRQCQCQDRSAVALDWRDILFLVNVPAANVTVLVAGQDELSAVMEASANVNAGDRSGVPEEEVLHRKGREMRSGGRKAAPAGPAKSPTKRTLAAAPCGAWLSPLS